MSDAGPTDFDSIRTSDGRRLAFSQLGDPAGRPAFYFHGFPGSRKEGRLVHTQAQARGIRVIAVDRPGYGASDAKPGRTLLDWADDVAELADALALRTFHVIGASGGGPYVAACAARLPDRIVEAGILCGMGPADVPGITRGMLPLYRVGLDIARRVPGVSRPLFAVLAPLFRRRPELLLDRIAARAAPSDRAFFDDPACTAIFLETFREAFRHGSHGAARDGQLYALPWGFRLEDIRVPVRLWHGERDTVVPVAFGRHVASKIPGCRATFYPEEGHFSLALNRADEIVAAFDVGTSAASGSLNP